MSWSTSSDVRTAVQRRWVSGALLRAHAAGEPFPVVEVPLRGPRPAEIGARLGEVQTWARGLIEGSADGRRYDLVLGAVGGREVGRNTIPRRAVVSGYAQAWALLGRERDVRRVERVLAVTAVEPVVRAWVGEHPLAALELAEEWPRLLAAYRWLDDQRGSGRYLREVSAPGVDTKFAERHRPTLAQLLGVRRSATGFLTDLGLRHRPELVRLRPHPSLGLLNPLSELAIRRDELAELQLRPRRALVVENEISYLSVPVPADGVVLWGKGFEVEHTRALTWLRDAKVTYWGDLDTHGFAILDRLRAWLPQTRSVLMDRRTLLAHRERWVVEDVPTSARLSRLTEAELALYTDLVGDRLGAKVRLEQERIDWGWAIAELTSAPGYVLMSDDR